MALVLYISLLVFITANGMYLLIFSLGGLLMRKNTIAKANNASYLVLYPVYKEDAVILDSVKTFIRQDYPGNKYKVCVLADTLKDETIAEINNLPNAFALPIPAHKDRNKAKSINYALSKIDTNYDYCIVLDADNTVDADFLSKIDSSITPNQKVIQVQRVAKNKNNTLAFSDGLSEKINNHIFRAGHYNLGLSASLIGSGMVIKMSLFQYLMHSINAFSGFDKELELKTLEEKVRMHYLPTVVVYDEKVQHNTAFVNQKRRWLFAQYNYLVKYFPKALRLFYTELNIDYMDKIIQFVFLPRLILLGLTFITFIFGLITHISWQLSTLNLALVMTALVIPIRKEVLSVQFLKAVVQLPMTFIRMCYALVTSRQASKKFIHTPHNIN